MAVQRFVHIDGHDHLVRDTYSMGVINTNSHALEQAKRLRTAALRRVAEEQRDKQDLNTLRSEVADLKHMIQQLLDKQDT